MYRSSMSEEDDMSEVTTCPGQGNDELSQGHLITELRDRLIQRLGHAVHRMMEKVDDALFELAEKSENIANQSLYFDAMREVRLKRGLIEDNFRVHFREAFDARLSPQKTSSDAEDAAAPGYGDWGLVDDEAVEEQIAVSNLSDKVCNSCREELYALEQRVGSLLGSEDQARQPAAPEVVCESIRKSLADLQSGLKVRLIILKLFDRYVAGELLVIYHDCNEWLVSQGILPELRTRLRNPRTGRALVASASATLAGESVEGTSLDEAGLLQALRSLLSGEMLAGGAGCGPNAVALAGGLEGLTALQRGDGESWGQTVMGDVAWSEGLRGEVNVLRSLKGTGIARAFGAAGDLTIDIVAMLFDYILDDRNIPSALRGLIGRLQIPVVKVALLDTGFFSRKSHPARRLLNTLAEAATGWTGAHDETDPLFSTMEQLVARVNRDFERDVGLFAEVLEEFERFLIEEGERRQSRAERTRRVIGGREETGSLRDQVSREVERRTADASVNDLVRGFLCSHWQALLHTLAQQHGMESAPWRDALLTMDDLLESVRPKTDLADRRRLSATLPDLLARLKAGMERLELPAATRKRFLMELARVHSDAVRGRDTSGTGTPLVLDDSTSVERVAAASPVEPSQAWPVEFEADPVPVTDDGGSAAAPMAVAEALLQPTGAAIPQPSEAPEDLLEQTIPDAEPEDECTSVGEALDGGPSPCEPLPATEAPGECAEPVEAAQLTILPTYETPAETLSLEFATELELQAAASLEPGSASMANAVSEDGNEAPTSTLPLIDMSILEPEAESELAKPVASVTPFELSGRQARRITEDLVRLGEAPQAASVIALHRGPFELASPTESTSASLEQPGFGDEPGERTQPQETLADVLRARLLQDGEVSLSDLVDPAFIEDRLSRSLSQEPLERTQPEVRFHEVVSPAADAGATAATSGRQDLSAEQLMAMMASGEIAFEEVTLADGSEGGGDTIATEDDHTRLVAALETGTWIEFTEEDGSRRQARLTWINSSTDTFMFTDRKGLKVADRTRNGLIADFRRGAAQLVEQAGTFDQWMGRLMDGLGRAMNR
jgi:hypothetical protein